MSVIEDFSPTIRLTGFSSVTSYQVEQWKWSSFRAYRYGEIGPVRVKFQESVEIKRRPIGALPQSRAHSFAKCANEWGTLIVFATREEDNSGNNLLWRCTNAQLVTFDSIDAIRQSGFEGFVTISALQASKCNEVPTKPGVYFILRSDTAPPDFLSESVGGHFKGKNPTVAVGELESKWVEGAVVLNIGKAGPGATLRSRLKQYMRFGQGEAAGHYGGRYIWQLARSVNLLVCWKPTIDDAPRTVEKALMEEFERVYGKLPFANLNY
ncbi:MAG: hypothetical protein WA172_10460 [Terriglobales bacterium]